MFVKSAGSLVIWHESHQAMGVWKMEASAVGTKPILCSVVARNESSILSRETCSQGNVTVGQCQHSKRPEHNTL